VIVGGECEEVEDLVGVGEREGVGGDAAGGFRDETFEESGGALGGEGETLTGAPCGESGFGVIGAGAACGEGEVRGGAGFAFPPEGFGAEVDADVRAAWGEGGGSVGEIAEALTGVFVVETVAEGFDEFGAAAAEFGLIAVAVLGEPVEGGHACVDGFGAEVETAEGAFEAEEGVAGELP
jgi:hypothetical protein